MLVDYAGESSSETPNQLKQTQNKKKKNSSDFFFSFRDQQLRKSSAFTFDRVFDCNCNQKKVFDVVGGPVVADILKGYNCTIFAYGQTSSGKTYTVSSSPYFFSLSIESTTNLKNSIFQKQMVTLFLVFFFFFFSITYFYLFGSDGTEC